MKIGPTTQVVPMIFHNPMVNLIKDFSEQDVYKHDVNKVKTIINCFIKKLVDYLITTGDPVSLPHGLGVFRLFKYDTTMPNKENANTKKLINYNATKKYKESGKDINVRINNAITNDYWWTFKWFKNSNAPNSNCKQFYKCNLVRPVRRSSGQSNPRHLTVTDFFRKTGWQTYIELPKTKKFLDLL